MKKLLFLVLAVMLAVTPAYARNFTSGDTDVFGNGDWFCDSGGDIEPSTDSAQDIGSSGNEVQAIYVDNIYSGSGGEWYSDQINVGLDGGGAGAYYVNMTPGIASLATGTFVIFRAGEANSGACTLTVDSNGTSLGTKSIKAFNDTDPPANYIEAGSMVMVTYDYTSNVWELISPDANP